MNLEELKQWLADHVAEEERNLGMIIESNRRSPIPDIVARRVTETQIMDYRHILQLLREQS